MWVCDSATAGKFITAVNRGERITISKYRSWYDYLRMVILLGCSGFLLPSGTTTRLLRHIAILNIFLPQSEHLFPFTSIWNAQAHYAKPCSSDPSCKGKRSCDQTATGGSIAKASSEYPLYHSLGLIGSPSTKWFPLGLLLPQIENRRNQIPHEKLGRWMDTQSWCNRGRVQIQLPLRPHRDRTYSTGKTQPGWPDHEIPRWRCQLNSFGDLPCVGHGYPTEIDSERDSPMQ